jgi:hypothetical protein
MIFRRYCRIPNFHLYERVPGNLQKSPWKELLVRNVVPGGAALAGGRNWRPAAAGLGRRTTPGASTDLDRAV